MTEGIVTMLVQRTPTAVLAMTSVASCLAVIAACKTVPTSRVKDQAPGATTTDPSVDGAWSAITSLKDVTATFPGTHEIPRPDDGWWVSPIHANLLGNGSVLVTGWSRPVEKDCVNHQGRLNGTTFLLNPLDLDKTSAEVMSIQPIDEQPQKPGDVLYCAGHAPLPDGRILFMGGARYYHLGDAGFSTFTQQEFGLPYARIFDPRSNAFTVVSPNNPGDPQPANASDWVLPYEPGMMWYPTNTRLPGGKILTNGGYARWWDVTDSKKWNYLNRSVTIFDPAGLTAGGNPWQVWVHHKVAPREVSIDTFDFPHVFVLPTPVVVNGDGIPRQVAIYGGIGWDPNDSSYQPGITLLSLDPAVPEAQRFATPANGRRPNNGHSDEGKLNETTAALLASGELMIMGGGNNGLTEGQRLDVYNPQTDQWRSLDTGITRHKAASTLLPDGTVLLANGEPFYDTPRNTGDQRQVTIYDPVANTAAALAPWADDNQMRGYHNLSLLLKDGRVLIGGGRIYQNNSEGDYRIGCERPELRLYSPPYLFKGPRPDLGGLAEPVAMVAGGSPLPLTYSGPAPRAQTGVVLMAVGAETHGFDQNQRLVNLPFTLGASGQVTVSPPANTQLAPEGDYILYLVSDLGVPSVGKWVRVAAQ